MVGPALAAGSALAAGAGDYVCGTTARRIGTLQCMFAFFTLSLGVAVLWVVLSGEPAPGSVPIAAGLGAGLASTVALGAFMRAMVVGTITFVAPISATGVIVPIVIGTVRGEQPSGIQVVGILAAIGGVTLAVQSPGDRSGTRHPGTGFGLAVVSAAGFGLFYWLVAPASRGSVPWAAMLSMAVPVLVCGLVIFVRRASLRILLAPGNVRSIVLAAGFGLGGFVLYAFATRHGRLPVVSVLASLFPVVTITLAYTLLGERVHRVQQVGLGAVLAGVILMTLG